MNENAEMLGKDDVIKVDKAKSTILIGQKLIPHIVFTVDDFTGTLLSRISNEEQLKNMVCNNGIEADVLVPGKSWRKGKVRLTMEFIPDESSIESPLDEFRNKPNN